MGNQQSAQEQHPYYNQQVNVPVNQQQPIINNSQYQTPINRNQPVYYQQVNQPVNRQVNHQQNIRQQQINRTQPSAFKQYSQPIRNQPINNNYQVVQQNNHNQPISLMNVNDRINQFKQRELTEEEQFQQAQERLREAFRKKQEERRRRFYAEVESFERGQENPYQILGISPNVDQQNLKKAYKKMAIQYHPDKGGSPEIFKKITQAYIYVLDKIEKSKRMNRTFEDAKKEFEKPNDEYIDKQVEATVR